MPSFGHAFAAEPDKMWQLVHYILHVVEGGDPELGVSVQSLDDAQPSEEAA